MQSSRKLQFEQATLMDSLFIFYFNDGSVTGSKNQYVKSAIIPGQGPVGCAALIDPRQCRRFLAGAH
jgi:hypothetical protein